MPNPVQPTDTFTLCRCTNVTDRCYLSTVNIVISVTSKSLKSLRSHNHRIEISYGVTYKARITILALWYLRKEVEIFSCVVHINHMAGSKPSLFLTRLLSHLFLFSICSICVHTASVRMTSWICAWY